MVARRYGVSLVRCSGGVQRTINSAPVLLLATCSNPSLFPPITWRRDLVLLRNGRLTILCFVLLCFFLSLPVAAGFYPSPEWSAFRDGTVYGSGRLSVKGSSLALWEWTVRTRKSAFYCTLCSMDALRMMRGCQL